ncbi:MAG TPA: hypothetical protein VMX13_03820 [Sedimentisphaerales bacterium]|nr:hypothetical protein [Sedimentisphaerales bacterium]
MVKLLAVLLIGLLLLPACSSVEECRQMRITGYGRGEVEMQATKVAWQNAREKLLMSGLQGYAIVEEGTSLGRTDGGQTVTAVIRFRVVPAEPGPDSPGPHEPVKTNR